VRYLPCHPEDTHHKHPHVSTFIFHTSFFHSFLLIKLLVALSSFTTASRPIIAIASNDVSSIVLEEQHILIKQRMRIESIVEAKFLFLSFVSL
jgi:hypothetical protein